MSNEKETEQRQQGPFEDVTVRKYEISPITITVTESRKSTHVPPVEAPCGCGGGISGDLLSTIMQASDLMRGPQAATTGSPFAGEGNPSSPFDTSDVDEGSGGSPRS